MRPTARPRAIDVMSHLGDYTALLCAFALTIVMVHGLQHIGARYLPPRFQPSYALPRIFRVTYLAPLPLSVPLATPAPAPQPSVFAAEVAMSPRRLLDRWNPLIAEASRRFGLSKAWIKAVMRIESGGRTVLAGDEPITSNAGAVGIMQVMPETYREMRAQYRLGADPFNPHDNVIAGAAYLHWLYRKYGFPDMFAAYNGGPGRLEDHLANGAPLPEETQNYIESVVRIVGSTAAASGGTSSTVAMLTPGRHTGRRYITTIHG